MKKVTLIVFLAMTCVLAKAQIMVNGVDINSLKDVTYIEITTSSKASFGKSPKVNVFVDYGQKWEAVNELYVSGPDKNAMIFNSRTDVINFFYKNGWELISIPGSAQGSINWIYVLKRKE